MPFLNAHILPRCPAPVDSKGYRRRQAIRHG